MTTKTATKAATKAATRATTSCGVLLFQQGPLDAYLVLYRKDGSPDLPKGHKEKGETDEETALRELVEETGIRAERVRLTPGFVFESTYPTRRKGAPVVKTVRVFHGVVDGPVAVEVSDHADYAWLPAAQDPAPALSSNPTFLGALRAWNSRQEKRTA
jgi:8-oxo-dGTP pyrophosphatase MutT (NUDIX family)